MRFFEQHCLECNGRLRHTGQSGIGNTIVGYCYQCRKCEKYFEKSLYNTKCDDCGILLGAVGSKSIYDHFQTEPTHKTYSLVLRLKPIIIPDPNRT